MLQESETFLDLINYSHTVTSGLITHLLIISIFFILMMKLRGGFDEKLAVSSYACFILSIPPTYLNLIATPVIFAFLAIGAFTTFYMYVIKR
jgi:hypothetical protein